MIAKMATGALQNTKPHCQLPPTIGSTKGSINATGRISPISRPLVYTAVAKPIRCGSQLRTAGGMVTCMMATPAPMAMVMA